jgi:flavin reductase (DIM6/NTAB) family NADH-FMN oxidoreductase RutF
MSAEHVLNAAPFSFFNAVSADPPLLALSVSRNQGNMKDTARNIVHSAAFVVHMVNPMNVEQMNQSSAPYPADVSEVDVTGLTRIDSSIISVPGIVEAPVRMECVLYQHIPIQHGEKVTGDLFLGRVVMFHVAEALLHEGRVQVDRLQPISRLSGASYGMIGHVFDMSRPTV